MVWNDEFTRQVVHIDIANDKVAPAGWNKQIIYGSHTSGVNKRSHISKTCFGNLSHSEC